APKPIVESVLPKYYNRQDGTSLNELIKRALDSNQELAAARLEIDKAKARLAQAKLRPNPTLEFEQESGRLVGNGGDGNFTVGASLPIEI
ncbi:TolC family protein, partial [Escherichia coli]|nr:TolC family protein [Escherichia coli]